MSSNCPPQLQLSIQSTTPNFKRSFEEFGFDLDSPIGATDGSGASNGDGNDRNKRARSSSSFSESSDSADGSHRSFSASDSSSTSNSSLLAVEEPPVISRGAHDGSTASTTTMRASPLDPPPRLPTPMIQDIDMTEVLPEAQPQHAQPRHQQVQDRYRLSVERFNAFENEISILRRSQNSTLATTRPPTPPPTLPPLSIVSSSPSSSSRLLQHPQTHIWPQSSQNDMSFLHHLPARTGSPLTENIFADVGEGSSSTYLQTETSQVDDQAQVSDNLSSGPRFARAQLFTQSQRRLQRDANAGIEEELEVVNGFRERLNSALERLRSTSPLVPELGDSGREEAVLQEEGSTGRGRTEEDADEEISSLPADPPTLPPIPLINADEWAHPLPHGLSESSTAAEQTPDIARDQIRRQTSIQQRFLQMRQHQQQRLSEVQQYLRSSSSFRATNATSSSGNHRTLDLSDHYLPSPVLRDFPQWMDERPPAGETSTIDGIGSGLRRSPRTDPHTTTASPTTDGNINQEQRQPTQPSHVRATPLSHSHTTVDSSTWRFVNSLFTEPDPSTLDTELVNNNNASSLSPTAATVAAAPGPSRHNPPSSSSTNLNSDTSSNSGSVSYSRNLTDQEAVRSLDHGIGAGLGFGTGARPSNAAAATLRRRALLGEQTRSPEERRENPLLQGSSLDIMQRLRSLSGAQVDFRLSTLAEDLHGSLPDLDLDFSSMAGNTGSSTSSTSSPSLSLSSEMDYSLLGRPPSNIPPPSPGIHRIPDFLNPTMSSLDFLSPTAAATAPSNLPVNIRHLWGESPRNPREEQPHVGSSSSNRAAATSTALPGTSASTNTSINYYSTFNPSSNQIRMRRESQPRRDIRDLFGRDEPPTGRTFGDYMDSLSFDSSHLNSSSSYSQNRGTTEAGSTPTTTTTTALHRLNGLERNTNINEHSTSSTSFSSTTSSFLQQRPRPRLQSRPGLSTSLVGETAAEVRRRDDYDEITRASLRGLLDGHGTRTGTEASRPTRSDQISTTMTNRQRFGESAAVGIGEREEGSTGATAVSSTTTTTTTARPRRPTAAEFAAAMGIEISGTRAHATDMTPEQVSTSATSRRGPTAATAFREGHSDTSMAMRPTSTSTSTLSFDRDVHNAWRSIHGLEIPDATTSASTTAMDDETSAINRLFDTRETTGTGTAINASSISTSSSSAMDPHSATRNDEDDSMMMNVEEDVDMDMLAVRDGEREPIEEGRSWSSTFGVDSENRSWLDELNGERDRDRLAGIGPGSRMGVEALIQAATEGTTSFNRDLDLSFSSSTARRSPFWNEIPRGRGAEGSTNASLRRTYSEIFETEPRSGESQRLTNDYIATDFAPALPSPDLGGSFEAVRPPNSTPTRSASSFPNIFDIRSTPVPSTGFAAPSTRNRPETRPPLPRVGGDYDLRFRSSLLATLTRDPTRDSINQPSHTLAEARAHQPEQRPDFATRNSILAQHDRAATGQVLYRHLRAQHARFQELNAQSASLLARAQTDLRGINPSAYAPGPFRNTLQHRFNEQTQTQYTQAAQRLPSTNNSNPPTIPPLSFGDENLASLSGSVEASPRSSDEANSSSSQTTRESTHVVPRSYINVFDPSTQTQTTRFLPRYASSRTSHQFDLDREILHPTHHHHHLPHSRPDENHLSRASRDFPLGTTVSPHIRNPEPNTPSARYSSHSHPFFRPLGSDSADPRPANTTAPQPPGRLTQPPVLRTAPTYGRYMALAPHLMHIHSPEESSNPSSTTGQAQGPANSRRYFTGMLGDDTTEDGGHPFFATRARRARPHVQHPHEVMFSFGRGLRRGRALGDFMRDEDFDESYESLLSLAQTLGDAKPKSTPADIIEKLEKGLYKDWATPESDQRCPICLDDYESTDTVLKLNNCSHWLHQDCLHQWLQTANTCPVCRKSVTTSNPSSHSRGPAHHHHQHRVNPFGGPATSFRHHVHVHPHLHAHASQPPPHRRQRSTSTLQPTNPVNSSNAEAPPPLPLPSSTISHHHHSNTNSDPTHGNGGNPDDNAPWRRAPRD